MGRVGFGIIGCGNIGPVHAEAISQIKGARLVAVSDIDETRAQLLAQRHGAQACTDYMALLERDDIQAISLCVPSGMRVELAEKCAAAGKHILAEKPLEISTKRIDRLVATAAKHKVLLGGVFQSRFSDGSLRIHQAIQKGRFGKLILGDAYIKWYRSQEYYNSGAWRGTRKLDGGGALMNQGIHQIDLLLWFMGPVKWVRAETRLMGHEGLEVEDLACAMIQFENGAMGMIEGSTAIWHGHPARVEVHGTQGSVVLEDNELTCWEFDRGASADTKVRQAFGKSKSFGSGSGDPLAELKSEGHRRNIEDFVKAIQENRPPMVDGAEGRKSVQLIEAIYRSASQGGKTVYIK